MFPFIIAFIAFPDRSDALFKSNTPTIFASGSIGYRRHNGCQPTLPNQTLIGNEEMDWCSNLARKDDEYPWISYTFPGKVMKLTGYSVRNGCCLPHCCCIPESDEDIDIECCCELYSFSLQGSNDNHTWKVIHQIEEKRDFFFCKFETYEFPKTEGFRFIRFKMDKERPQCPKCLQLNQIELYGEIVSSPFESYYDYDENEESVSIIGKIRRY